MALATTHQRSQPSQARGFTLIEVMVALTIVAIALIAGLQATSALTLNAQRQSDVLLAHLCAENELVQMRLAQQMPSVGNSALECVQAGIHFDVLVRVQPTPNPNMRRVDAQVMSGSTSVLRLTTLVGKF